MAQSNHSVNVITFSHPEQFKNFGFKTIKLNGASPLRKFEYPNELWENHKEDLQVTDCLYTDFTTTENCKYTAEVDLTKSPYFAKHYYNYLIYNYFKRVAPIVFPNFVEQIEIWILDTQTTYQEYQFYYKFTLTIQMALITNQPELVVAFDGKSKVLKKSILELVNENIDTQNLKLLVYRGELVKYKNLPPDANNSLGEIYPVLNPELADALHIAPHKTPINANKYKHYFIQINRLLVNILKKDDFKAIIPHSGVWHQLEEAEVLSTSEGTSLLKFGSGTGVDPYEGLKKFHPCAPVPTGHYKFLFIYHEYDKENAQTFHDYSTKKKGFINFSEFLSLPITYDEDLHIVFKDLNNPLPEIKAKLQDASPDPNIKYIAVYISPYSKYDTDPVKRNFYYQVKQVLLKYRITSQVVLNKNIKDDGFKYSVSNIAVAVLAKLGGIPWRLDREINKELIVGIGAFKTKKYNMHFIGSTFCFTNDGKFKRFDSFPADDLKSLAGSIREAVVSYREANSDAERIVIHFYKKMSKKEIDPIIKQLRSLQLNIPVVIVTINKTEADDLVVFDMEYGDKMPMSGTYISIGRNNYILCNNTRHPLIVEENDTAFGIEQQKEKLKKMCKSYPLPVKLHLQSTDETIIEDPEQVKQLIDQVYQFSRMYWKSVSQQNLPVTIKYPELIAEMYANLPEHEIPTFGLDNLWFL